jgi:hypothetical protein
LLFSITATLLVFFGGVALKPSDATIYSPITAVPDIQQDCRDACSDALHAAQAAIDLAFQAGLDAISAMQTALMDDAENDRDAILNDPNATPQQKIAALVAYQDRITGIHDTMRGLRDALLASTIAARQLAFLAYEACLAVCALIPPFDIEIEIPFLP